MRDVAEAMDKPQLGAVIIKLNLVLLPIIAIFHLGSRIYLRNRLRNQKGIKVCLVIFCDVTVLLC